jgi:hypothetical protein
MQVSTYNRRKQGVHYLQSVLSKLLNNIISDAEFDMELKPLSVYNKMIADHEVQTGNKWTEERLVDEKLIMEVLTLMIVMRSWGHGIYF